MITDGLEPSLLQSTMYVICIAFPFVLSFFFSETPYTSYSYWDLIVYANRKKQQTKKAYTEGREQLVSMYITNM